MSFEIIAIENFERELKRLSKKYPSLKKDLGILAGNLEQTPIQGVSIGNNCYKIRLAISSKGQGKSGGARVITLVKFVKNRLFLLSIYDKSEQDDIPDKVLTELVKRVTE